MTGDGRLRVLIATSAFSMGVDFPDIRNVVHVGPPSSLVQYVQESGRVGRDGKSSVALLLYGSAGKHVQESMKSYCTNKAKCRRNKLFKILCSTMKTNFLMSSVNAGTFVQKIVHVLLVSI